MLVDFNRGPPNTADHRDPFHKSTGILGRTHPNFNGSKSQNYPRSRRYRRRAPNIDQVLATNLIGPLAAATIAHLEEAEREAG